MREVPAVASIEAAAYTVPLDEPESDGTLTWDHTTVVVVHARAGDRTGLGFTYGPKAVATVVSELLAGVVDGRDALDVPGAWEAMVRAVRNGGRPGLISMAVAAVDVSLWDLKAKLLALPLARLLGRVRASAPVYGSGGFTSLDDADLARQLGGWACDDGIPRVKIKIGEAWGSDVARDEARIELARRVIGDGTELFVDANGAYDRKQAIRLGPYLEAHDVRWFEEPVSSDDLAGLHEVRSASRCDVAAGEYGYSLAYFQRMCSAGAVDVLQADVSRCAGITEWLRVAALAAAHGLDLSGHCAQSLTAHPACSITNLRHLEYFADHARVDRMLFDGVLDPTGGALTPDDGAPGLGLHLKTADAEQWRVA